MLTRLGEMMIVFVIAGMVLAALAVTRYRGRI